MKFALLWIFFALSTTIYAQYPEFETRKSEVEAHLRFLASDDLKGRRTGEAGNFLAARYIAEYFNAFGAKPITYGNNSYLQQWPLESVTPPVSGGLMVGKTTYEFKKDFMLLGGSPINTKTTAVFAGHGWVDLEKGMDDYKNLDVKGKVVFVISGLPDDNSPNAAFRSIPVKRKMAEERGAVALIELYRIGFPWGFALQFFSRESHRLGDENAGENSQLPYGWLKEKGNDPVADMVKGSTQKILLSSSGGNQSTQMVPNVAAVIQGSDPELSNEYIVLSAHFDHVGVGKNGGGAVTPEDSIFNGARDNAFGTSALLLAARCFAEAPAKRSIILIAFNGEEMGLLGSRFYADKPLIPLEKVIFNLNADGAGYNDKESISAIGYGRTGTDDIITAAANTFGLKVIPNPVPEQNLFDRSDNVSFAAKGVPSLCLSPGVTSFDEELMKYYHQVADNPDSVDTDYLLLYCKSFVQIARMIADNPQRPEWKSGDKYEEAGKKLYKK
jgi:hypothetical protein